jgi:hypothetical protein
MKTPIRIMIYDRPRGCGDLLWTGRFGCRAHIIPRWYHIGQFVISESGIKPRLACHRRKLLILKGGGKVRDMVRSLELDMLRGLESIT